jgi:hypothetical protein
VSDEAPTEAPIPYRQQPVSLQQALAAAMVTALIGVLGGSAGGITFGSGADVARASDVARIELQVTGIEKKIDTLAELMTEIRIGIATHTHAGDGG